VKVIAARTVEERTTKIKQPQGARVADRSHRVPRMATAINSYRCDDCGWVYDPAVHGDRDLLDQDPAWTCPSCQAEVDHFELIVLWTTTSRKRMRRRRTRQST
jgi:rubredoxin